MRALLFEQFKGPLRVAEVPDPVPHPDGVVIEVKATGLCRSDWHGWQGHDADIQSLPHVPGHEFAGLVAAVGDSVRKWRVGDRVTIPFVAGCGSCWECVAGHPQVCERQFQPGFTAWGSFAERVAVRYADCNLVRLPEKLDFATAASLGCRTATAYRAVAQQGRVRPGDWIAIHGAGGVGLSAVAIAKALGARPIAIDIRPKPLALALELGAEEVVNAAETPDVPQRIREITGRGANVSLDALGSRVTATNSILCLARRGRHVQVGLLAGDQSNPPLPMGPVISWELEIVGSHGMAAIAFPELLELVTSGRVPIAQLVTRRISLDEAPACLAALNDFSELGVTVIEFDSP
jgi:alcohol dehydrogenase